MLKPALMNSIPRSSDCRQTGCRATADQLTERSCSLVQAMRRVLCFIFQAASQSVLSCGGCLEVGAHAVEVVQHIVQLGEAGQVCCGSPLLQQLLCDFQQGDHLHPAPSPSQCISKQQKPAATLKPLVSSVASLRTEPCSETLRGVT